ncbi:MAG: EAL domain-containing protein, partial [Acidimicrobiia bacterium]|nr:EAL domain-containing protein [Acidimicrobiia bacterium]
PEAAPSDPVWSDRDGSEEVRLIVEDGTVVESHGPASERLGYDPTNTDASSLLEAAFTGEAIPHAHRSGIWLNVATDPESESESLVITVHEPGMGRPVDRIDHHSGLPNLNDFELQGQLSGVVVIVFHLHDLERVRDSVGSEAGDSFVRRLASRARRSFRERHDRIWRGDGSKLIVMTPIESRGEGVRSKHGTAPLNNDHRSWIEARRLSLSTPTALGMSFIAPAISAGFTVVDKPIPAIEALQQAEMALMYARDNQPRSTVEYTSELHARMAWEWQIESYLAASLDDLGGAGFSVHYQPIVEASTGLVKVVEGLCRWRHPELGSVSPTEFIPIAERTGVIARIDDFVLAQAIGDVDRFRAVDPDIVVQVNMSPSGLKAERLAETAKTILRHLGGDHPGITIEITESALTDQPVADLAEVFAFLREGNIGISLDDFGTGESNFERLSRLPFTQVKLAHDFVRSNDVVLVSNVVQLVHGLGMKCVVEGVETTAQYEVAVAGGGDLIQGWIFARAMPRDDALHYTQIRRESILAGDDKQRAALTTDLGPGPVSSTGVTSNPGQQAALLRGHDPTGDDHKNPAGQ